MYLFNLVLEKVIMKSGKALSPLFQRPLSTDDNVTNFQKYINNRNFQHLYLLKQNNGFKIKLTVSVEKAKAIFHKKLIDWHVYRIFRFYYLFWFNSSTVANKNSIFIKILYVFINRAISEWSVSCYQFGPVQYQVDVDLGSPIFQTMT